MIYQHWVSWFQTRQALRGLPQAQAVQVKTASGLGYGFRGQRDGKLRHCQIMIGLKGTGYFERGKHNWEIPPGTAILYDFKDPQMYYGMPPNRSASDTWQWLRFGFFGADEAVRSLCKKHPAPFSIALDSDLVKRLLHFQRLSDHEPVLSAGASASLVVGVLDDIQRAMQAHSDQASTRLAESLENWLQEHAGLPGIRIQEAADLFNVSQEHLTRCFSQTYGSSPKERLEQLHMRAACRRMSEENSSIGEIASELGYSSSSHFARRFKKQYGLTPGDWRRKGYPPLA